jgi:hypothetical protein
MELLKNVFIRLVRGGFTDRVIIIDNVPQEMFYELQHPRVAVGKGQEQHWEADRTQTRVMTLYPELSFSQTGDGSIVFDLENEHSKNRYLALDRFVKSVFPNNRLPAEPVVYSTDPMDQSAPALELSKVPRVVLPTLSPSVAQAPVVGDTAPSLDVAAIKKAAIEEYEAQKKEESKERMAKVRESRNVK